VPPRALLEQLATQGVDARADEIAAVVDGPDVTPAGRLFSTSARRAFTRRSCEARSRRSA
jgi:hypothetical protein